MCESMLGKDGFARPGKVGEPASELHRLPESGVMLGVRVADGPDEGISGPESAGTWRKLLALAEELSVNA
jgi:hypothetical protein